MFSLEVRPQEASSTPFPLLLSDYSLKANFNNPVSVNVFLPDPGVVFGNRIGEREGTSSEPRTLMMAAFQKGQRETSPSA